MKIDDSRKRLARGGIFEDEVRFHQLWRQYRAFEQEILKIFLKFFASEISGQISSTGLPFYIHVEHAYRNFLSVFLGFLSVFYRILTLKHM